MATIQAFKAIHPNPFYADQLVFTTPQAESVAGDTSKPDGLPPLKTLLETGARHRPETTEGQDAAYKEIEETLKYLLDSERLWKDKTPGIYIYEVMFKNYRQVGIWALTDIDDLIKKHELTFPDSVRRIKNYRQHTGLEGSPILLTYPLDETIETLILNATAADHIAAYSSQNAIHKLWKIEDPANIRELIMAFSKIGKVYMADGHHRLESARQLEGHPWLSSLYMSDAALKTNDYHRVFIPETEIDKDYLFKQLMPHFYLHEAVNNQPIRPKEEHRMGLYLAGKWYYMAAKPHTYAQPLTTDKLDVEILQNKVLGPLFGITDPGTDHRLKHLGGDKAVPEMQALFKEHPLAIGFTLFPMAVAQLIRAAENDTSLPPKSTWIDPKVPYGLLLYKHETHA